MIEAKFGGNKEVILELENVRFDSPETDHDISLILRAGEMAFLRGEYSYGGILGLYKPAQGKIRFRGRDWEELSVRETENFRKEIGIVVNPDAPRSKSWISNLDVDENVYLGASFEPGRNQSGLRKRAKELAVSFGLSEGIPTTRSAQTFPADLIRSQWVRALLTSRLHLLILENPLESAPAKSIAPFLDEIKKAMAEGTSVLWISESPPSFETLGLTPTIFINER